jgi:hypothetical protein
MIPEFLDNWFVSTYYLKRISEPSPKLQSPKLQLGVFDFSTIGQWQTANSRTAVKKTKGHFYVAVKGIY